VICQEYYVPIIAFFATTIWKTSWMQMRFAYDELTEGISMGQLASHVTQDAKHALRRCNECTASTVLERNGSCDDCDIICLECDGDDNDSCTACLPNSCLDDGKST
jgi:hypothetical protein